MTDAAFYAILLGITTVLGLRGSIRLTRRYLGVRGELVDRERWILLAFVIVSWAVTVAAMWFGWLTVRRLLGFAPVPETAAIGALIATVVMLIPAFLDWVVERVARVPWR